jgi:SAM-dependent methyltransferase
MESCRRVLKPNGSFYVAIGDEFAAEVRTIGRELGLHLRNWIVWYYTFGQSTKAKFARSHTHIFYFVMDSELFTFNDVQLRVPSARHTEYSDKRANPMGKLPDDVWFEFPRVCGTYKERQGWHGCQMPEALLMRIVRASSNPGDLVLDPFSGSGTTLVAAARLRRRYLGVDISREYVAQAKRRLKQVSAGSAHSNGKWTPLAVDTLCSLYRETNTAWDRLVPNKVALACFTRLLNARLDSRFADEEVAEKIQALASRSNLPRLRNDRPYAPRRHRRRKAMAPPTETGDWLFPVSG